MGSLARTCPAGQCLQKFGKKNDRFRQTGPLVCLRSSPVGAFFCKTCRCQPKHDLGMSESKFWLSDGCLQKFEQKKDRFHQAGPPIGAFFCETCRCQPKHDLGMSESKFSLSDRDMSDLVVGETMIWRVFGHTIMLSSPTLLYYAKDVFAHVWKEKKGPFLPSGVFG